MLQKKLDEEEFNNIASATLKLNNDMTLGSRNLLQNNDDASPEHTPVTRELLAGHFVNQLDALQIEIVKTARSRQTD
jgi:hypothetical protein